MVTNRLTARQLSQKNVPIVSMTLVSIACKRNLTYVNNYLKTIFLCASSRQNRDMTDYTDVDRRTLYVNAWTPLAEPHICNNLHLIYPRATSQFQIRKV